MAGLETTLTLRAKDEAGAAFAQLKAQISAIDKQIATFDKLMNAVSKTARATDPLVRAIGESTRAFEQQKLAVAELSEGLDASEGAAGAAAGAQERLRRAIESTSRVMTAQGVTATRLAEKIAASQKAAARRTREGGGIGGMGGGLLTGLLGFELAESGVRGIEAGATLDQALAKLRTTGVADADIAKARSGYTDFSKTHGGMTEAEYLTAYGESRTMSSDPLKTTREMALFTTALRNSGVETTAEEARSFVKAMDELSLSPAEQENFLDRMVKVKQLYGGNITGETFLAAQRRSSMAAYGWNETFRENYFPFMLQSLGVTGGNDIMTAYSNYIGKHMQHTEMMNLAKYGFIRPGDEVLNKVGDIKGLKPGAHVWEEDVMKANPAQWAWDMHSKFMSRKGAKESEFTTFVGTLPRAMGAMIEFFTHGEGLAARDLALGKHPIGLAAAGNEYAAQNPMAALASLRASIEQFGAALTSEPVKQASAQLVALSQHVTEAASVVAKFEKDHPGITKAATTGTEAVGGVLGLGLVLGGAKWLVGKALSGLGLGGLLGGGGAAGAAGGEAAAAAGGGLARIIGGVAAAASLPALIDLVTGDNRTPQAKANDAAVLNWIKSWISGPGAPMALPGATAASPVGTPLSLYRPLQGRDVHSPSTGPFSYYPAEGGKEVTVSGEARVDHEIVVRVEPSPLFTAIVDQARQQSETVIPLVGGGSGRMDSDAGPTRVGIGHM
jgi:hypothetical protein